MNKKQREEFARQHRESCNRIRTAFEAVLVWLRDHTTQNRPWTAESYLEWARLWVALGRILRECDVLRMGHIARTLRNFNVAGVPPCDAAASLLLLASQVAEPEDVARHLAVLHAEPGTRQFSGWLPSICQLLTDGMFDVPPDTPAEDMLRVYQAVNCTVIGAGMQAEPRSLPLPDTCEGLLAHLEFQRKQFIENAHKAGQRAKGIRVDRAKDFAAYFRGNLGEDVYILPRMEPYWIAAAGLNLDNLPPFPGEPQTGPEAIHAFDLLMKSLRANSASEKQPNESQNRVHLQYEKPLDHSHPEKIVSAHDPAPAESAKPRWDRWAIGIEAASKWHLFRRTDGEWRAQRVVEGLSKGRQARLLQALAEGGGFLTKKVALQLEQKHYSGSDVDPLMSKIKPEISRLRKIISRETGIKRQGADPLPYDDARHGWQAALHIGYAIHEDGEHLGGESRLRFRSREELTPDDLADT